MMSLNMRVLLLASAVLTGFFGLAGVTLDRTYRQSAEQALKETLQGHVYTLIAAAELGEGGRVIIPEVIPDPRFSILGSGLFAQVVRNSDNSLQWQSLSMKDMTINFPDNLARTESATRQIIRDDGRELFLFSYGVSWEEDGSAKNAYTFSVAQELSAFNQDINSFRKNLWGSMGAVALLLLAVQGTILRWGLLPLKRASEQLTSIEQGTQNAIQGPFPRELKGLTHNINALLAHQHEHLDRYRKSLGDLAHSLKTPLAVMQNALSSNLDEQQLSGVMKEQVERIDQITGYQLQRAATAGWMVLSAPVQVEAVINKVLNGLKKVYADKRINMSCDVTPGVEFHGDEGDLLEIVGNLADNACKWCHQRVTIHASNERNGVQEHAVLIIRVDDDGPGIQPEMAHKVIERGQRMDQDMPGHGIGLSIVQDIIKLYGGTLEIGNNEWGGASVSIKLSVRAEDESVS